MRGLREEKEKRKCCESISIKTVFKEKNKKDSGAGGLPQQLRPLAAHTEEEVSVSSTHKAP